MHISRHLLQLNSIDVEDNLQLADIGELQIAVLWVSDWGAGGSADQFSQADYHSYSFSSLFILYFLLLSIVQRIMMSVSLVRMRKWFKHSVHVVVVENCYQDYGNAYWVFLATVYQGKLTALYMKESGWWKFEMRWRRTGGRWRWDNDLRQRKYSPNLSFQSVTSSTNVGHAMEWMLDVILWRKRNVINSFYEFSFGYEIRTAHCQIYCV